MIDKSVVQRLVAQLAEARDPNDRNTVAVEVLTLDELVVFGRACFREGQDQTDGRIAELESEIKRLRAGSATQTRQDARLNAMVDRFLGWKLPKDFGPDAGISFKPYGDYGHDDHRWPIGTNLLTAEQAKAMFRACVPPSCFGLDDCSTQSLAACPWAEKCGKSA